MRKRIGLLCALALVMAAPVFAEDEASKKGWETTTEFGLVVVSGNSESQSLIFKGESTRSFEKSSFTLKAGAINAEKTTVDRTAFGIAPPYTVEEIKTDETVAETYFFEGRYDRKIHERMFWFAGAGWDRNRPSGVDNRYTAFAGIGNIWRDDDKIKFRTDYALSYTDQEDVIETPDSVGEYAGVRASWTYKHKLTESTKYSNDLKIDYGLEDSDTWRADMTNAVAVSINKAMALKVSLQWLYNNNPPTELIPLFDVMGPGGVQTGTLPYELDELDTIFGATLVVNF